MWLWIAHHWGWIVAALVLAVYFGFYVLAVQHARTETPGEDPQRFRLPCDRC